jgi:hypothetical protein
MGLLSGKDKKSEKKAPAEETSTPPAEDTAAVVASAEKAIKVKETRKLVSYSVSERKALVEVNGVTKKAVYDVTRKANGQVAMLGCPGEPSVNLDDWLAGKAHLKGLQG